MMALLLALSALAQDVDGFAEVRAQGYIGVDGDIPVFMVERVRPTFTAPLGERVELSTTIEAGVSQGWRAQTAFADLAEREQLSPLVTEALGQAEHTNELLAVSAASDYLSVDRLYLDFYSSKVDVRVGRQALNWGSGFAVNPSDPFPEVLLTQPWKPRSGLNAVRVIIPFGELNAVRLVAASDDSFTHPRLAGRVTVNALQTDWSLVGAWREEIDEGIVGLDFKGTLGIGYWFEGVVHLSPSEDPYEELAVGVDYSFPVLEQLMVTAQYYRNGSGRTEAGELALFQERKAFAPAFSGRDYLMVAVSAGFTPDVSGSAFWLQNLNDGTAYVVPSVSVVLGDRVDLSVAGQVPLDLLGDGGEFKPLAADLVTELPGADGTLKQVDLSGIVPAATVIVWTRFNF